MIQIEPTLMRTRPFQKGAANLNWEQKRVCSGLDLDSRCCLGNHAFFVQLPEYSAQMFGRNIEQLSNFKLLEHRRKGVVGVGRKNSGKEQLNPPASLWNLQQEVVFKGNSEFSA